MSRFGVIYILVLIGFVTAAEVSAAAQIPPKGGNVASKGFTHLDFCAADGLLYAFNGLNLYKYNTTGDIFEIAFAGAGAAIPDTWDPADFSFLTDCNNAVLPTGQSQRVVYVDRQLGTAQEKSGLRRNYFSTACRYRDNHFFANGVGTYNNTIYLLEIDSNGTEMQVSQVSNKNSGAIAFDFADNLYIADFKPIYDGNGLGQVDIYIISRGQLDSFIEDNNFAVVPRLIVNDVVLAGSDSIVIDANYDIYVGSYSGIAKISPTNEPNIFGVLSVDGNIYANPLAAPGPHFRFCGITADIKTGKIYYGKSELNEETWKYSDYFLQNVPIAAAANWSADLNGDGIVDFYDLYLLQEDYLCSGQYLAGDLNNDSFVDFQDFVIFAKQWRNKTPWYKEN